MCKLFFFFLLNHLNSDQMLCSNVPFSLCLQGSSDKRRQEHGKCTKTGKELNLDPCFQHAREETCGFPIDAKKRGIEREVRDGTDRRDRRLVSGSVLTPTRSPESGHTATFSLS